MHAVLVKDPKHVFFFNFF